MTEAPTRPSTGDRSRHVRFAGCCVLLLAFAASAASAQSGHHPFNFSFFYPISTNQDPGISTNFRLNVLYGRVGSVRGVDLSGVVARTDRDFRGLQLVGVVGLTGGDFRGIGIGGATNIVGGEMRGLQAAGGVNFVRGPVEGIQVAGLLNYGLGGLRGAQVTAFFNMNDGDGRWLQLASVANLTAGKFSGLQLAGGINVAQGGIAGAQIGVVGVAGRVDGFQLGAVNVAGRVDGAQIGLLNIAQAVDGAAIGLVNWTDDGDKAFVLFASSLAAVNAGLRTEVNGIYSMLTAGVSDLKESRGDTGFLSWHLGHVFPVRGRWGIGTDVGFVHIMPQPDDDPTVNDRLHFALQARALVETGVSGRWTAFAGGGVSAVYAEYSKDASSEVDPLVVGGVIVR